jgi:hypothetical protein
VVGDDQDRVGDGDGRLGPATTGGQTSVLRRQVGALGTRRGVRRLDQAARSQGLPLRVLPLWRLPALSLLPGQRPAQEATCLALGKRVRSEPISATSASATERPTPGIASRPLLLRGIDPGTNPR